MIEPQTFFHVGYARAASTFLQKTVFPALTGIQYIPRNRFRVRESEKRRFKSDKVLMSREAGQFIYQRCDDVLRIFGSKIIVSLRRQDALASSLYRLNAKNGHTIRFPQFLDVEQDSGAHKVQEFRYMQLIDNLQEKTGEPPLVLIFEDYLDDPNFYLEMLCKYLGCGVNRSKLDHRPVHGSYSDKQLRLRRQFSDIYLSPQKDWERITGKSLDKPDLIGKIKHRLILWSTGPFMNLARITPDSWLSEEPLIEEADLEKVREFFSQDWAECQMYVAEQAQRLGVLRSPS